MRKLNFNTISIGEHRTEVRIVQSNGLPLSKSGAPGPLTAQQWASGGRNMPKVPTTSVGTNLLQRKWQKLEL